MSSYLKRWRSRAPRAVGASEEWEELGALSREASDREEEDAVVVAAASAAAADAAPPPAKVEASPPESKLEEEEEDKHPFALLQLRIRPATVAFWGRWWATCVLLVTTGMLSGGIVARGGASAVRLTGSAALGDGGSPVLRGEYKGVAYECAPVMAQSAPAAVVAPPVEPPPPPPPAPPPPLTLFVRAEDVAEGAAQLAEWIRCCALDATSSNAVPLARWAGAAAHRAHRAADIALRALDAAGRGIATGSSAPAHRESAGMMEAMDKLRKGMREGVAARLPQRPPVEALRDHTASLFF